MTDLKDVENIEGGAETPVEYYKSLQRFINSGTGWKLQGHFGRSMMNAIEEGRCMLGEADCRDYWGNHIPSRTQVQDGSKGSRDFVVAQCGEDWALMLEGVSHGSN
jgi:hypothetical protein